MAVSHLEVTRRTPFAADYERVDGKLHFAVDPGQPANTRIADLDKAPRDAAGKVRFWADFVLLQPAARERSNGRLLHFVVNRGQRVGIEFNRYTPRLATLPPTDEIDVGDGFLMQRGWTVSMCGWQWDVQRQPGLMGLEAPQAPPLVALAAASATWAYAVRTSALSSRRREPTRRRTHGR